MPRRRAAGSPRRSAKTAVADHFAAVSTALDKVAAFGIAEDRVFGFWDWVGGRYSMWSAIGLPLMIAIGPEQFRASSSPARMRWTSISAAAAAGQNLPVLLGLIGIWHRDICGYPARAVHPLRPAARALPGLSPAARHGIERQARDARRRAVSTADRAARLGRARHQRPARLLPAPASGHRHHPVRVPGSRRKATSPSLREHHALLSPIASRSREALDARPHDRRGEGAAALRKAHRRRGGRSRSRRTRSSPATGRRSPSPIASSTPSRSGA